ncbi:hypothetical protein KZZ52_35585 [Dactylosporangium sp. AC04546]|uniref:hypothetical protein n=1 Tax=Dactylosporangium sp. AC04546 TaxID=2862460 RepID=UPI001EE11EA5|nr:hypothetical protein [Dactylosporangium sp. AC04546]WVK79294.1 hypothetical protein KZZ52_35585 [Dactylosporangium sp. AC04546]
MRSTYRVFAYLVAAGVLVQVASVAFAWFTVIQDIDAGGVFDKNAGANPGHLTHAIGGMAVIPLVALLFLIVSFFAKVPGGVKWAGITFGLTALQVALAFVAFSAPVVGTLHGLNAFALLAVAAIAGHRVRRAVVAPAPQPVAV